MEEAPAVFKLPIEENIIRIKRVQNKYQKKKSVAFKSVLNIGPSTLNSVQLKPMMSVRNNPSKKMSSKIDFRNSIQFSETNYDWKFENYPKNE